MKIVRKIIVLVIGSVIIQHSFALVPLSQNSIYRATSADGLNFLKEPTVLFSSASMPGAVTDKNGRMYLYYVSASQPATGVLNVAVSIDGQNFTTPQKISIKGSTVIKKADPHPVLLPDGSIRLYYIDSDPLFPTDVHSAISVDGFNFTEEKGIRFAKSNIATPDVFKVNERLWVMLVSNGSTLVRATSADGLNFTEDITFNWNKAGVCSTLLFPDNILRTYYSDQGYINSATSINGDNLSPDAFVRVASGITETIAQPTVVHLGAAYIMYYTSSPLQAGTEKKMNFTIKPQLSILQSYNSILFQFNNLQQENHYMLKIYDGKENLVYSYENISGNELNVPKKNLQSGTYVYNLLNEQNLISKGQFLLE